MGKLKILASGNSPQAKAQIRGKLFEKLMTEVHRHYGYSIDHHITNVDYAGMEIDIEGRHLVTGIPFYAECKCYETEMIDAPKLQAFYGKYMAKWLKEKRSHGLFIALPGINSHTQGSIVSTASCLQRLRFVFLKRNKCSMRSFILKLWLAQILSPS